MAAGRKGRNRSGRRRSSPPVQALEQDLLRRNLARAQREELVDGLTELLVRLPQIARRRHSDRQAALQLAAGEVLGWAALIAERGPDRLVERLFSASCVLNSPCAVWWQGLVASGMETAVAEHVARRIRELDRLVPDGADRDRLEGAGAEAVSRLRALTERIDARDVQAPDVVPVAAELLVAGLAQDPEPGLRTEGALYSGAALWLLEADLPVADADSIESLQEGLRLFQEQFPAMLGHARAHVEDPSLHSDEDDEDEDEDDEDDDEVDERFDLGSGLQLVDDRLSVTEDPDQAAALANLAAMMLTATSAQSLAEQTVELSVEARLIASGMTLSRDDDEAVSVLDARDLTGESRDEVRRVLLRAADLLESDRAAPEPAPADTAEHLMRLDTLIDSLRDAIGEEDSLLGGLGLAAAAVEVLRVGVALRAGTPGCRAALVGTLAVLDPMALAVDPVERRRAARHLHQLAERLDSE
jgi:hypothetical protein